MDSPDEVVVHHHHYFGLGDASGAPPGRLSAAQYDRSIRVIHWPPLLRQKQFSEVRYQLDQLFHKREPGESGFKSENYERIRKQCEAMVGILASEMNELDTDAFAEACRFIKALESEARFPAD